MYITRNNHLGLETHNFKDLNLKGQLRVILHTYSLDIFVVTYWLTYEFMVFGEES